LAFRWSEQILGNEPKTELRSVGKCVREKLAFFRCWGRRRRCKTDEKRKEKEKKRRKRRKRRERRERRKRRKREEKEEKKEGKERGKESISRKGEVKRGNGGGNEGAVGWTARDEGGHSGAT